MKNKKILPIMCASLFALCALASCTSKKETSSEISSVENNTSAVSSAESKNDATSVKEESSAEEVSSITSTYKEVTINTFDASGNAITQTFKEAPKKVICNNLSAAKTMIDLGLESYIIGMPNTDNAVTDSYKEKIDAINKLGDKKTISKETIINLEPDFIVGRAQMFSSTSFGTYDELNTYGINVYAQAASVKTATLNSVLDDITSLGKIFNVEAKAEELVKTYEADIQNFTVADESTTYKNALVMCNFNGSTFGSYKSVLQEKGLNALGYTNCATGTSGLSLENLVTMDPELIIYINADRNKTNDATALENLKSTDAISEVKAIKNDNIVTLGYDDFMEYGANIISALKVIHASAK